MSHPRRNEQTQTGYVTRTVTVSIHTRHHIEVATIPAGTVVYYRKRPCTCCMVIRVPGTQLTQVVKAPTVNAVNPLPYKKIDVDTLPRLDGGMVGF